MKPVLSLRASNGYSPNCRQRPHDEVDHVAIGLAAGHDVDGSLFRRHVEMDVENPFGVVDLVQEQPAGVGRRIAGEDGVGGGQFVELAEDLLLQLEPLRDGLDDQPRVVHRLGEVSLSRNPPGTTSVSRFASTGRFCGHVVERGARVVHQRGHGS